MFCLTKKAKIKKAWSKMIDGSRIGIQLGCATEPDNEEFKKKRRIKRAQDRRFLKMYNGYEPFEKVPKEVDLIHPYNPYSKKVFIGDDGRIWKSEFRKLVEKEDLDQGVMNDEGN